MSKLNLIALFISILILGCKTESEPIKESWIGQPVSEWPSFALTNEIGFEDTVFKDLANSFLINTGFDTIGVSCKHLFMVFEGHLGINTIDLGNDFKYWKMYPKNDKEKFISTKELINKNSNEQIGQFNTLKVRDWIIFSVTKNDDLYPLKIRYTPIKKNEIVYAIGWGFNQHNIKHPSLVKLQCFKSVGDYFYTKTLSKNINPEGSSGSAIIDKNGYLVGIVSGQEGNLGVVGGVKYLLNEFDKNGVKYNKPSR